MTTVKIRYEINETYGCISGTQTCLYLIPSKESESGDVELYLWSNVGPGEPMNANQNRWFSLGSPGTNFVGESLMEFLEGQRGLLLEIDREYQGSHWDGNNHRGRWSNEKWLSSLSFDFDSVDAYWSASDWFQDGDNLMGLDGENLEECAESEADFALDSGVRLDLEEVKQYLLDKLREKLDEMEMEEDDEVDEKLRDKFRALVAT